MHDALKSVLQIGTLALTIEALTGCTYPDPQTQVSFSAFLPKPEQMRLTTSMIPAPLSIEHARPERANAQNAAFSASSANQLAGLNHDRAPPPSDPSLTDLQLQDLFDPFYIGSANIDDNKTDANCGAVQDGEVAGLMRFTSSWCTMGVIKIALHRAVTLYDNFHFILVDIVQRLTDNSDQKGLQKEFINDTVVALDTTGVRVQIFYDDCVNHRNMSTADPGAFAMCQLENDNAVYHRARILPHSPTPSTFITRDSVIGKMEWVVRTNTSVVGNMAVSNSLMTPDTYTQYAPQQMQFEFESDSTGRFQSFVIKFAPQLLGSGTVSREFGWAANVIRVTREPGTGGNPGTWTAQGSIMYELAFGWNPIGPNSYEPFNNRNMRLYFVAVAEDVFAKGLTVYKAILTDGNIAGPLGLQNYPVANDPINGWDRQLHMWSSYKKALKQYYTKNYYLLKAGTGTTPVRVWDATSRNAQVDPYQAGGAHAWSGTQGSASVTSIDISRSGTPRLIQAINPTSGDLPRLQIWAQSTDTFGHLALRYVGSCEPFSATGVVLSNIAINPANGNQVLVGDIRPLGTHEARIFDLSGVTSDITACPTPIATFILPTTPSPYAPQMVAFSPDGTKILTRDDSYARMWVWDVTNTTTPLLDGIQPTLYIMSSVHFDSTSTRIIGAAADNASYVTDINTGATLRLYNDEGVISDPALRQTLAFNNPLITNQVITGRTGNASSSIPYYPGRLYRWDITSWNPNLGSTTWSTSTSPYLVQTVDVEDNANVAIKALNSGAISPTGNSLCANADNAARSQEIFYRLDIFNGQIDTKPFLTNDVDNRSAAKEIYANDGDNLFVVRFSSTTEIWPLAGLTQNYPGYFKAGHDGSATSATLTKDGLNVVTTGVDKSAILWSIFSGTVIKRFDGHTDTLTRALFTHNNKRLVTSSVDGTVKIWDADRASAGFGSTLYTIPARTDGTGLPIGITWIDYDDHFGMNRIVTAEVDGTVNIYDIATNGTATLLKSFPTLFFAISDTNRARSVDFSDDGTLIIAGGIAVDPGTLARTEIFLLSANPTISYGANGSYNNLGGTGEFFPYLYPTVDSAIFYPGSSSRVLVTSRDSWTTKVINFTLVPNATDPVNIPPTYTGVEELALGIAGRKLTITPVGSVLHALITEGSAGSSGCANCGVITHWDVTPGTANFGKQFSLADPTGVTAPYGQPQFNAPGEIQNRPQLSSGELTPNGLLVISAGAAANYNPAWTDFDGYFNQIDANGIPLRPDEGENVNPYYAEHVVTAPSCTEVDQQGRCTGPCFEWDAAGRVCTTFCFDPAVGGCATYQVTSQFTFDKTGVRPNPPAKYNRLIASLHNIELANPTTAGYYLGDFVYQPLN